MKKSRCVWHLAAAMLAVQLWTSGGGATSFLNGTPKSVPMRSLAVGARECGLAHVQRRGKQRTSPEVPPADFSIPGLALVGAFVGPFVDAIHNQALLSYDVLPVALNLGLGFAKTSLLVPPLLAIAYALLGSVLPGLLEGLTGTGGRTLGIFPLLRPQPVMRAALAVASTCFIIKSSELLLAAGGTSALLLLSLLALLQWAALDGRVSSLGLALLAGVLGPLAELPLIYLGAWHYIGPDYWPLAAVGLGPGTWAGLSMVTGPCYFAVTTDAIALGRLFSGKP